jgi:hypothetical protein
LWSIFLSSSNFFSFSFLFSSSSWDFICTYEMQRGVRSETVGLSWTENEGLVNERTVVPWGGMGLLQLNRLDSSEMLKSLPHQWKYEFFPYPSYHVLFLLFSFFFGWMTSHANMRSKVW